MRNISTYIEFTLMTRHYAFVPGIGGFLLRDIDASYEKGKFTPSHREVHFNRFLTNDDGMLANAYMMAEGISYDEAISQIHIEVAAIKSAIERKKSYELGNLGVLSYDSEHHLVVKNPKQYPLDPDCYGLETLNLRTWQEIENSVTSSANKDSIDNKQADIIAIPKYWVRRAVVVLAIVICFFSNFDNFNSDGTRRSDYAAVFDTEVLFGNTAPNYSVAKSDVALWESEVAFANEIDNTTETNVLVVSEPEKVKEASAQVVAENKIDVSKIDIPVQRTTGLNTGSTDKLYYVIIASCSTQADALRAARKKVAEGYTHVGIIEKDGRYRLYLKSFTKRTECESFLEQVRISTPFQTAWLLPVRQESLLSYYLKNIDNDQLPMELSHPYKRTERDQG